MAEGRDKAAKNLMSLQPTSLLSLYRLYPDYITKPDYFFDVHDGSVFSRGVTWQGKVYQPMGIETEGFETNANGRLNRPKIRISNKDYFVTNLAQNNDDFKNGKVIRKRVFLKFLDDVNFDGGNPFGEADPTAELFNEEYLVSQKVNENKTYVELELTSPLDLDEFEVNTRRIFSKFCYWKYRGEGCGYEGPPVQKADGTPFYDLQGNKIDLIDGDELSFQFDNPESEYDPIKGYQKGDIVFKKNNRVTIADPAGIEEPKPLTTYYVARDNVSGFDPETNPKFWERDGCNKKVSSCKLRFFEPFNDRKFIPARTFYNKTYQFTGDATDSYMTYAILQRIPRFEEYQAGGISEDDLQNDPGTIVREYPLPDVLSSYDFPSESADILYNTISTGEDFSLFCLLKTETDNELKGPNDIHNGILQTTWNLYDGLRLGFERFNNNQDLGVVLYYTTKDSSNNYIDRSARISSSYDLEQQTNIPVYIEKENGEIKAYFPTFEPNGFENPVFETNWGASNQTIEMSFHELGLGVMPKVLYTGSNGRPEVTAPSYNWRAYQYADLKAWEPTTDPGDPWEDFYNKFKGRWGCISGTRGFDTERDSNGQYFRPYLDGIGDGIYPKQNEYALYRNTDNAADAYLWFNTDVTGWVFSVNDYGTDNITNDKYIVNSTGLHDLINLGNPSGLSPGDHHIMQYDTNQSDRRGSFAFDPSGYFFFGITAGTIDSEKSKLYANDVTDDFTGGLMNYWSGQQFERAPANLHKLNVVPQKYKWQEPGIRFGCVAVWSRCLTAGEKEYLLVTNTAGSINARPLALMVDVSIKDDGTLISYWDVGECSRPGEEKVVKSVPVYCPIYDNGGGGGYYNFTWDVETYVYTYPCDPQPGYFSCDTCTGYGAPSNGSSIVFLGDPVDINGDEFPSFDNGDPQNATTIIPGSDGQGGVTFVGCADNAIEEPQEPTDYCSDNNLLTWEQFIQGFNTEACFIRNDPNPVGAYEPFPGISGSAELSFIAPAPQASLLDDSNIIGWYICDFITTEIIISPAPTNIVCDSSKSFDPKQSVWTLWHTDPLYPMCKQESTTIKNQYIDIIEEGYNLPFGGFPGTDPFQFRTKL